MNAVTINEVMSAIKWWIEASEAGDNTQSAEIYAEGVLNDYIDQRIESATGARP